ncbi:hypothetical protein [Coleofasciculus sp. FACHB-SPT9]|uniref:hypothetical protein n=1 Tax=Cyanophyceae TaxID=3028117 RepID=UPI0016874FF4|nr:hypothetical protein [Coleofasciculus sp. FACHB-SPT9]MBD1887947.1 hypothetical protein [Coleofasciculus sp. FACHB-SPT9]
MNQFEFVQYESEPRSIELYEPGYRYDPDYALSRSEEAIILVLTTLIVLAVCGAIAWNLPRKVGYKGLSQWLWFGFLVFPFTTVWTLLAFVLIPSPKDKELKVLKAQLKLSEDDLDSKQKQIERNVEYIKKANLAIETLKEQAIKRN